MASRSAKKVYGVEIVEHSTINEKENAALNKIKMLNSMRKIAIGKLAATPVTD